MPESAAAVRHNYRHVRGLFDVQAQPPIQLKGLDEAFVTYLVSRARPRPFRVGARGIEGVKSRMIGRDAELGIPRDSFERLFVERKRTTITIVAEAGIGKSQLL
jgi:hypothetical protein